MLSTQPCLLVTCSEEKRQASLGNGGGRDPILLGSADNCSGNIVCHPECDCRWIAEDMFALYTNVTDQNRTSDLWALSGRCMRHPTAHATHTKHQRLLNTQFRFLHPAITGSPCTIPALCKTQPPSADDAGHHMTWSTVTSPRRPWAGCRCPPWGVLPGGWL